MGMESKRVFSHHEATDGHHSFGEEVPRNSGGRDITAGEAGGPLPCRIPIMGDEHGDVFFVVHIKDRDKDLARLEDIKLNFEIDRPPDIEAIHDQP